MPTEPKPLSEAERAPASQDDKLVLAMEVDPGDVERRLSPWKVLVVDDEEEVHAVTRLALADFHFDDRPLQLLNAYSGAQARQMITDHPDIALILLDVVMESDDAGLAVARFVREELGNHIVRIVLRTGQPGMAPERQVLKDYDINDYRTKTELTQSRMFSVVYTALSSYRLLLQLGSSRHRLTALVTELQRSNRELEKFAYIASHDLQSPLRGITTFAQLLQRKYEDILDNEAREYLGFIFTSAAEMRGLIDALLTLSRVGSNVKLEDVDLGDLMVVIRNWLRPIVDERQVVLEASDLPTVQADRTMLIQLLQNLINNAIKFQERTPPRVRVFARRGVDAWIIGVEDHGIGIKPQHFERIFEIFQRLHPRDKYEGSGIGLAVCEKIVHLHGGRIWVESQLGQGSTFFFSIPDPEKSTS